MRCSDGTPLRQSDLSADDSPGSPPVFCLTVKPTLVVLNTGEKVDDAPPEEGALAAIRVPIDIEAEIAACAPEDRDEMREMYGVGESALSTVARAAYHLLGRRTFLTTGEDESRAWTFRAGAKAPECAGVIHSDLQRGFSRAEVIDWEELLEIGSWSKAREAGKLRVEGKDYEVRDGDVLEIRFNV
jgi:ribosome-binding ATPase YchF (GTP1/OBG family)